MKHSLATALMMGAILIGSASVQGAPQRDRDDERWYHERDTFYQTDNWKMRLFDRVREDLNRVQTVSFTGGDEYRIAKTKEELADLQGKVVAGKWDQPELDSVIAALGRVVADNRLSSRDRDMLNDDLTRLRNYREHHEP